MTQPTEPPTTAPARRRAALPWLIACVVVVVAAVAVTLVLTTGHAGGGDRDSADREAAGRDTAGGTTTSPATDPARGGYDLGTPEAAARSFAAAAATGSGDTVLTLACVGRLPCAREHAAGLGGAQLADAQAVIRENVHGLAHHLDGVEFASAVDGAVAGTKDVPYRTPAMTGDAYLTLTFVRSGGDWLYLGPAA